MKKIVMKTILPVVLTTGAVTGTVLTTKAIQNKSFSNEINGQKALNYAEKEDLQEDVKKTKEEALKEVETATEAVKNANNTLIEAEKELKNAKTTEQKKVAQAKVDAAKIEIEKAEQAKTEAERKVKQVEASIQETNKTETNTSSSTKKNSALNTIDNPSTGESESENTVDKIKKAIQNTIDAKSLTIHNVNEKWTKKYDKNTGAELIVYYTGDSTDIPAGILYSYKPEGSISTKSLFKEMNNSIWNVPSASAIQSASGHWSFQFSGKRSVGVIELELVKNLKYLISAAPIASKSLNGALYSNIGTDIKFYQVAVSSNKFSDWLSKYYGDKPATDNIMIDVGINSSGYVCYLKGRVLGDNKTRNFEIVLSAANKTKVPKASELGLSNEDVSTLEEEYKKGYDCEKEWTTDKDGNEYYYWVCGPNKHVNQHDF